MDSQIVMMMLVLPCFFGVTLVADGVGRMMRIRVQVNPWFSVGYGAVFIGVAVFSYFYLLA